MMFKLCQLYASSCYPWAVQVQLGSAVVVQLVHLTGTGTLARLGWKLTTETV